MNEYQATEQAFKNGYKKAAEEIFAEIDRVVEKYSMSDIEYPEFIYIIAKLKKKYTEEKT